MNTGGAMAHIPPAPRFLQKKHRACCRNGRKKLHLHTNGQTKHTMATNTTYRTDPAHAVQAQIRCALLTFAPLPLKFHNTYQLPSNLPATAGRRRMTQHGRTARLRISDNRPRLTEGVRNGADNRLQLTEGVRNGADNRPRQSSATHRRGTERRGQSSATHRRDTERRGQSSATSRRGTEWRGQSSAAHRRGTERRGQSSARTGNYGKPQNNTLWQNKSNLSD